MVLPGEKSNGKIYIGVVGVGGVGTHFLSQLSTLLPTQPRLRIALITSSTKAIYSTSTSPSTISLDNWRHDLSTSNSTYLYPHLIPHWLANCPGHAVLVDNTSSPKLVEETYTQCLKNGISIVTPNKVAFSASQQEWDDLQASSYPRNPDGGFLYHEATVGAGLPILSTIKDLLDTGDKVPSYPSTFPPHKPPEIVIINSITPNQITHISGVFSGTMSYLFNTFSPTSPFPQPQPWSTIVRQARSLGYTEPDPRDDLNGKDVARKLVILARLIGLSVASTDAFPVQSLIPAALEKQGGSADEFLNKLENYDGEMATLRHAAESEGKVLRFVGSIDVATQNVKVGVEKVGKGEPVAGLRGSDNLVAIRTERYKESPLVVQGAGAGGAVTAMGVLADLLRVVRQVPS
ncbi:MAG: Homoserine dehydrogenase [Ramalina farinacea]|uniref:Homoserine dehydrogenase n=1 Tax=Ramalina farinacea TaxID=258253 RepID=A0AA43TVC1_9LECA|nr:Homoserine dehydrogenase [Ramalina farinacea]